MKLRFLSLFSGLEGASLAWEPLGWECAAVAEVDPAACKVLAHHHPTVQNLGDVTKLTEFDILMLGRIDVVVMGAPCQSVSLAGKREGFFKEDGSHTRSGLFHVGLQIARWSGARFILYENVKGLFSSNAGRDFAGVVADMAGLGDFDPPANGWGSEGAAVGPAGMVEWSLLCAQWFGLAQRRERVFALLDTGDWASRPPILLERESLRGPAPSRHRTGQEDAGRAAAGAGGCDPLGGTDSDAGGSQGGDHPVLSCGFSAGNSAGSRSIAYTEECTPPLRASPSGTNQVPTLLTNAYGIDDQATWPGITEEQSRALGTGRVNAVAYGIDEETNSKEELFGTLKSNSVNSGGTKAAVAYGIRSANTPSNGCGIQHELTHTLDQTSPHAVCYSLDTQGNSPEESTNALASRKGGGNSVGAVIYSIHPHAVGRKPEAGPQAKDWTDDGVGYTMDSRGAPQGVCYSLDENKTADTEVSGPLQARDKAGGFGGVVAFAQNTRDELRLMPYAGALAANAGMKQTSYLLDGRQEPGPSPSRFIVRRLTPVEAARLQGVPDLYLDVPGVSETAKYKLLGNGFALPCIRWIGSRIEAALMYQFDNTVF